jgi:HPt (histidine-containing phosphotransfer) domain-containing protein
LESLQVVNKDLLNESCGGDLEFAKELFGDLSERAHQLQEEIHLACSENNSERLRKAAHELKGSSLTLGAERVGHVSRELEDLGRKSNLEGSGELLPRLDSELETLWKHVQAEGLQP